VDRTEEGRGIHACSSSRGAQTSDFLVKLCSWRKNNSSYKPLPERDKSQDKSSIQDKLTKEFEQVAVASFCWKA
jgi:hypothetical protein